MDYAVAMQKDRSLPAMLVSSHFISFLFSPAGSGERIILGVDDNRKLCCAISPRRYLLAL
jgi:hypothetical protein